MYAKHFDPNTREYIVHTQDIDKLELPSILIELSKKYFNELGSNTTTDNNTAATVKKENPEYDVYQCSECLTVYNPEFGDAVQNIAKGVLFEDLPDDYCCSLCEAPKSNFVLLTSEKQDI